MDHNLFDNNADELTNFEIFLNFQSQLLATYLLHPAHEKLYHNFFQVPQY
jgi:hypothetical protein